MIRVAIFASNNGSNFEAIVKYFKYSRNKKIKKYNLQFVLITNNKKAYVILRAKKLNIKYYIIENDKLDEFLLLNKFDLCVLAGYMKIINEKTLKHCVFINIHPSLLPHYKGIDAIKRIYKDNATNASGVSIHYVNKYIDGGEVIIQKQVKLDKNISYACYKRKVHLVEHKIYPKVIEKFLMSLC